MRSPTASLWTAGAVVAPLILGLVLRPLEDAVGVGTVTLVLVLPVVIVASTGRWVPAVAAALSGALAFDYLYTEPRGSLAIAHAPDAVVTIVLATVGVIVVVLARRGRAHLETANRTIGDVVVLQSVAELMAQGEDEDVVLIHAAFWLRDLLHLQDCRFELGPSPTANATILPGGAVHVGNLAWSADIQGLPGPEVDLPLLRNGEPFARFVLTPTPGQPVRPDRLLTASALADMLSTWLGSHRPETPR